MPEYDKYSHSSDFQIASAHQSRCTKIFLILLGNSIRVPTSGHIHVQVSLMDELQDVGSFLTAHPSITTLELALCNAALEELSTAVPQLEKLVLSSTWSSLQGLYNWRGAGMSGPPFPRLKVLELDDDESLKFE